MHALRILGSLRILCKNTCRAGRRFCAEEYEIENLKPTVR